MIKQLKYIILFVSVVINNCCFASHTNISIEEALQDDVKNFKRNVELLSHAPEEDATVGVVLIYKKKTPYLFLGRERIDGKNTKKAGFFSDLGGKAEAHRKTTLLAQMLRELKEESVDTINLDQQEFLKKAYVIHTISNKGRDILYGIYPLNDAELKLSETINKKRDNSKNLALEFLEKDLFLWLDATKILGDEAKNSASVLNIKDINGKDHVIKLRDYFIADFINNKDLPLVIHKYSFKLT